MSRLKKILIGFAVILALVGITGFFVLPPIVKPMLLEKLSDALHREVGIEAVRINPYTLSITLKGFAVKERDGKTNFISFDDLYLNGELLQSVLLRAPVLKEIRLTNPYLHVSRNVDESYNFSDLIPTEEKPEEEKPLPRFLIHNIHIINGSVDFWDGPKDTNHTVRELNLSIPFVSDLAYYIDDYTEPKFSAVINGNPFKLEGKTKPFEDSLETTFDIRIQDLDIPFYARYIPVKTNFKIVSAVLDTTANLSFTRFKNKPPVLKITGNVELKNAALDDLRDNKILRSPSLKITMASVEPLVPAVHLSSVTLQSPEVVLRRTREGELVYPGPVPARGKQEAEKKAEKPLSARIDSWKLEGGKVTFIDMVPEETATIRIDSLNVRAENISTDKGSKGSLDLAMTIDPKGTVSVKGPVGIEPLAAEMDIDVKNIALRAFQPYIADKAKINVTRGGLSTKGTLHVAQDDRGAPALKYAGNISVADFATIDRVHANDFLKWKSLYFDQLNAGYNPVFVDIRGISLTDFYARIIINPDGTRNVQQIFGKEGEEKSPEEAEKPAEPVKEERGPAKDEEAVRHIKVGKVTLQGGTIDFTDLFIKPNYTVKMLNMSGSVTGLSSEEISRAKVELRGNLGRGSPIDITGTINPLIKDRYVDMNVSFKDIELSPATPYAIKYLGYTIAKGKLTFDVKYLIEGNKLTAQNKFFFDQLTFGEKVESPDAIKLPVTTAVSLLKDRNGRINLDVPLSGSLDDPKFSVWPIVWQVIVNLITKAVTAPFALLGSLFGGGEELGYVVFAPGSADITEAAEKKLNILVKALDERPVLKMDIEGYVDPERDREGLKRTILDQKMKALKLNDMIRRGEPAVPVKNVEIAPQEYGKYLAMVYDREKFPKPRNIIGMAKTLPAAEMEKLILTHARVSESDLRLLGAERAENVKDFILESGKVTPDRIFVVEPKSLEPSRKEEVPESRVEFKLK
ncbi:MAG TPA: DUF748 domain-containing protein [Syntrophales bacterium]|nr:DUF748 domain-containing protein [Syntrophales bacterium]